MNREDATDIIAAALAHTDDQFPAAAGKITASHIAAALDALGLLPQPASQQQNQSHEHALATSDGLERLFSNHWASQRSRP